MQKTLLKNLKYCFVCESVLGALKGQVILEDKKNRTTHQDSGTFLCPVGSPDWSRQVQPKDSMI